MNGFYRQVTRLLREAGFNLIRQGKGSHEIWGKGRITLIVPHGCKSRHTANAILHDAGLKDRL